MFYFCIFRILEYETICIELLKGCIVIDFILKKCSLSEFRHMEFDT